MRWTDFVYRQQNKLEPRDAWRLHYFAIVLNCPTPVLHAIFWCTVVPLVTYYGDASTLALETYCFVKDIIARKLTTIYTQDQVHFVNNLNEDQWQTANGGWRILCQKNCITINIWHLHEYYDDRFFITLNHLIYIEEKHGLQAKLPVCGDYQVALASRFDAFFEYANNRLSQ